MKPGPHPIRWWLVVLTGGVMTACLPGLKALAVSWPVQAVVLWLVVMASTVLELHLRRKEATQRAGAADGAERPL
ncbi:MAG TPA: hypothetical protein VFI25_00090 [Planctomycetota bacterium]|nr:hypothetical protein [Planctomycetota bacterium]